MLNELIALQKIRKSKIILYATGDRPTISLQIDEDILEPFHQILESIGHQPTIDLFIYSRGGATIVPLPLVRLIRKYCDKFVVIVPFRAHSAATMISVGADEIYLSRKAELGPVDPQLDVMTPGGQRRYASTDIFAYIEFAKEEANWRGAANGSSVELLEFFHKYSSLPPDFIGKIYRMFTQSKKYIFELANSHNKQYKIKKISHLADTLTRGFGSHDYKIDSSEAKHKLGLNVLPYKADIEKAVSDLYAKMAAHLQLAVPFNPLAQNPLPTPQSPAIVEVGVILSEAKQFSKRIHYSITNTPPQPKIDIQFTAWL